MLSTSQPLRHLGSLFVAIGVVFVASTAFANPAVDVLDTTHAAVEAVMAAQDEVTPALMQHSEIWEPPSA